MDIDCYLAEIKPFQYVSFDIFDTLVFRTVPKYQQIFDIVALKYEEKYHIKVKEYTKQRVKAEREVRKNSKGKEITIEQIYSLINYDKDTSLKLRSIEEECEILNCVPNNCMINVLNRCKAYGKTIVVLTDMYLPRDVLEQILVKIGVKYDRMFISYEEGETKRTGKIFPVMLRKLNADASQVIHIGDDLNNDIQKPNVYGIKSLLRLMNKIVEPEYIRINRKSSIYKIHLYNFIRRTFQNTGEITSPFRIGYGVMGPLMFDFCKWLHDIKEEENLDCLYFVAREGYLIMKCYKLMYPNEENIQYIRLNKNLLRLPLISLNDDKVGNLIRSIPERIYYKWKDIYNYFYICDHEKVNKIISKVITNFNYNNSITKMELYNSDSRKIINVLYNYQREIIEEQVRLLDKYLYSLGFHTKKIGLVNNSMNGSGQSMINDYLSQKGLSTKILGLQFVKRDICLERLGNNCRGWITESNIQYVESCIFQSSCLILEHLLFEPSGTALYFKQELSAVVAVCEKPRTEYNDFDIIKNIQDYALKFVFEYNSNIRFSFTEMDGFYSFFNLIENPLYEDAKLICNLKNDDIEGDDIITDASIPLSRKYIRSFGIPPQIRWVKGYITLKQFPKVLYLTYDLLIRIKCYYRFVKHFLRFLFCLKI